MNEWANEDTNEMPIIQSTHIYVCIICLVITAYGIVLLNDIRGQYANCCGGCFVGVWFPNLLQLKKRQPESPLCVLLNIANFGYMIDVDENQKWHTI